MEFVVAAAAAAAGADDDDNDDFGVNAEFAFADEDDFGVPAAEITLAEKSCAAAAGCFALTGSLLLTPRDAAETEDVESDGVRDDCTSGCGDGGDNDDDDDDLSGVEMRSDDLEGERELRMPVPSSLE